MEQQTDETKDDLFDAALDTLNCQDGESRKIARWGLEQIVESVSTDCDGASKLSRADVTKRLSELATAATAAYKCLSERDVRRVLALHIPATKLSRILPDTLRRRLRVLAMAASNAAADPDLHGGGDAGLEDIFALPAKTKLAALADPVFKHFRGKLGAASANSDLDVLLNRLWEIISGEEVEQSFEGHIQQARAKRGRKTVRRFAALVTARLEAQDILDGIQSKQH